MFTTNYEGEGASRKCDECNEHIDNDAADTFFFSAHRGTSFPYSRGTVYELHFCATCIALPEVHEDYGPLFDGPTLETLVAVPIRVKTVAA